MATRRPQSRASNGKARTVSRTPKSKPAATPRPRQASVSDSNRPLLARIYLFFAHAVGAAARALSPDLIAKEDRRDGLPFAIFLGGIIGAIFTWFMHPDSSWVYGIHIWTVGLMFGRVAFGDRKSVV